MVDFKTVAIFTFASEYTVLQHLLEQAEIRFFLSKRNNDKCFTFS